MTTAQDALNHWLIKTASTMTRVSIPQLPHDDGSVLSRNERTRQIELFKAEVGQKLVGIGTIAAGGSTIAYAGYNVSLDSKGFKESNSTDFAIGTAGSALTLGIFALKNFVDTQCDWAKNCKDMTTTSSVATTSGPQRQINAVKELLTEMDEIEVRHQADITKKDAQITNLETNNQKLQETINMLEQKLLLNTPSALKQKGNALQLN